MQKQYVQVAEKSRSEWFLEIRKQQASSQIPGCLDDLATSVGLNAASSPCFDNPDYSLVSALEQKTNVESLNKEVTDNTIINGSALTFSRGIRNIRHLNSFLNVAKVISPSEAAFSDLPITCVVVWGRKQNSRRALRYALRHALPTLYVEDGWIRSCSANAHSRVTYSLLVDNMGVYYDGTRPSALEDYLNRSDQEFDSSCGKDELTYAAECRRFMIENNITKYNYCSMPDDALFMNDDREIVLVLDQTLDDASVKYGGMDQSAFNAMLDRAIDENPHARVVVRTHPDVARGLREGYLQSRARALGIEISACADNPIVWLKRSSKVYVGTSQLGYEAILCGCTVKVAGQPFYSGWGLTEDWQTVRRRIRNRTLDQIFHATHVYHARYCCPVTGKRWTLQECLQHVRLQQDYFRRNQGRRVCIGITPWKRKYLSQFLRSPHGELRFSKRNDAATDEVPVYWSFHEKNRIRKSRLANKTDHNDFCSNSNDRCIRVEDGFIRSSGLGSDFVAPASLVFDSVGLYFDASKESELERLLKTYQCNEDELIRARRLRRKIASLSLTKYNVGSFTRAVQDSSRATDGRKSILVVGQVEGDQSILRGCREISSNSALVAAVRESNPSAFIVYKPHPDVVSGNRKGTVDSQTLQNNVNAVETRRGFLDCLNDCDELHTMTSLSGFEAVLRGKTVVTYGMPFYAGWGLTHDNLKCDRRTVLRSVDELVYVSLVLYPHYVDLSSGEFITVEQLIHSLAVKKLNNPGSEKYRWLRKIDNVFSALTYQA